MVGSHLRMASSVSSDTGPTRLTTSPALMTGAVISGSLLVLGMFDLTVSHSVPASAALPVLLSKLTAFDAFPGPPQQRLPLLEVVAEQRHAEQILGGLRGPIGVRAGCLLAQGVPILDGIVVASEPGERDEVDLLVLAQPGDERRQLEQ